MRHLKNIAILFQFAVISLNSIADNNAFWDEVDFQQELYEGSFDYNLKQKVAENYMKTAKVVAIKELTQSENPFNSDKWDTEEKRFIGATGNFFAALTGGLEGHDTLIDGIELVYYVIGDKNSSFAVAVTGGKYRHFENAYQRDFDSYSGFIDLKYRPLKKVLGDSSKTEISAGEGWNFSTRISEAEVLNRDGDPSKKFLNYLSFQLKVGLGDLAQIIPALRGLHGNDKVSDFLNHSFFVHRVYHRSGAWGTYGSFVDENGDEQPIKGAVNYGYIGFEFRKSI